MSEKKDYFDYVENVLGVKSIILNAQTDLNEIHPLLICVEGYSDYVTTEKDLLAKMIAALKIDLKKIKIVALSDSQNYKSEYTIYFVDAVVKNQVDMKSTSTYSPRALLRKPELKKNTWDDLQKVISFFNPAK